MDTRASIARTGRVRLLTALLATALLAGACTDGGEEEDVDGLRTAEVETAAICSAEGLVSAIGLGAEDGTLSGMADDPVVVAASNNPVLATLVEAIEAAELGDTLNNAESLTVFAPTDCAFAELDAATLEAALTDPSGRLTQVLGFHVIPGQRINAAELTGGTLETFNGEDLAYIHDGRHVLLDGQARVVVPDIQTANATVHLIDRVLVPSGDSGPPVAEDPAPSAGPVDSTTACTTDALHAAIDGGAEEGTLQGMADDPVAVAASNTPVLSTLVEAVVAASLVDTLNSAEAVTIFAPTDCAFAALDPSVLEAALADPDGLLAQVLGFHVVIGERLQFEDLESGELETLSGIPLPYTKVDNVVTLNGQARIVLPNIQTANGTIHLVDTVMLPATG